MRPTHAIPLQALETEACALLEDVIYSLYAVLDQGVFGPHCEADRVGHDAIGRMNNLLARLGRPVISEEDWIWHYYDTKMEPKDGERAAARSRAG